MDFVARKGALPAAGGALLGVSDPSTAHKIAEEIMGRWGRKGAVSIALNFSELRHRFLFGKPRAILLDDRILAGLPLAAALRLFEQLFPVILLAPLGRQNEAAEFVTRGDIEFVAREGDFFGLTASLVERRLRSAESRAASQSAPALPWPPDIGELFRHEINNPLTGILGNAELMLAHRERFNAIETQRLETVVDLAVRLRETVRRISNSIETQHRTVAV